MAEKDAKQKKDTTISVLQDIRDLLIPMHNLARFQIKGINEQIAEATKAAEPKLEIVGDEK